MTKEMGGAEFHETPERYELSLEERSLLTRRISELSLSIAGTRLESLIHQLHAQLRHAGISYQPRCYLADVWGCPQDVPVIGIPFYLADPTLSHIEGELTGIEAENDVEILMYLRHEAGHAFNYAYRLHTETEWREVFGPYSRPYIEDYKPDPFSDAFVRHIPGWYAQKHPDEDFAETFAVWLTPGSNWREQYAGTPALAKLLYVEDAVHRIGKLPPLVTDQTLDGPVEQLQATLAEWYGTHEDTTGDGLALPRVLNIDLRTIFPSAEGVPAIHFLRRRRSHLIRTVNYWTGLDLELLSSLTNELLERVRLLDLRMLPRDRDAALIGMSILITTLAMNYRYTDQFVRRSSPAPTPKE